MRRFARLCGRVQTPSGFDTLPAIAYTGRVIYDLPSPPLPAPARLTVRPESSLLVLGSERMYSFDLEGRLITAHRGGELYRRGLDHRVLRKRREPAGGRAERLREDLTEEEKRALVVEVLDAVRHVLSVLPPEAPAALRARLDPMARWNVAAYAQNRRRFREVYRPVTILPPDHYLSVVLQATEGCHYNQCTFCDFYRDRPFRVKSEEEFAAHIDAVRHFLGDGLRLRRRVFLADANALVVPQPRLVRFFEAINAAFGIAPVHLKGPDLARWKATHPNDMTGVYSFVDAFTGKKKTVAEYAELALLGLRRVYIGIESGHVPLLRFLHKPSMPADVTEMVQATRSAGVRAGLIVMLGIGGDRYAAAHVTDTLRLLNALRLGPDDVVYLSEFVEPADSEYALRAHEAGIRALTRTEVTAQAQALRAGLAAPGGPKVSLYDIRESIY